MAPRLSTMTTPRSQRCLDWDHQDDQYWVPPLDICGRTDGRDTYNPTAAHCTILSFNIVSPWVVTGSEIFAGVDRSHVPEPVLASTALVNQYRMFTGRGDHISLQDLRRSMTHNSGLINRLRLRHQLAIHKGVGSLRPQLCRRAHNDLRIQGVVSKIKQSEIGEGIHHRLITTLGGPAIGLHEDMPADEFMEKWHPLLQDLHLVARARARPDWVGVRPLHVDNGRLRDEDQRRRRLET